MKVCSYACLAVDSGFSLGPQLELPAGTPVGDLDFLTAWFLKVSILKESTSYSEAVITFYDHALEVTHYHLYCIFFKLIKPVTKTTQI
jgi:hypothetical protein